jgi:hypothetical protein
MLVTEQVYRRLSLYGVAAQRSTLMEPTTLKRLRACSRLSLRSLLACIPKGLLGQCGPNRPKCLRQPG